MRVQVRTFTDVKCGRDVPPQHNVSRSRNLDAAPYLATWRLGAVINAFLCNGPACIAGTKLVKPFVVENLVIDIQPMERTHNGRNNATGCAETAAEHASSLVDFARREMETMFAARSGNYHVPWGPLALSSIRTLVIMAQGERVKQIDVAKQAAIFGVEISNVGMTLKRDVHISN
jgi:hypothetical protein